MTDLRRVAGVAGLAFIILAIVATALPGLPPAIEDPDSDILDFFEGNRTAILWSQWLTFLSVIPALFFFGYFLSELRRIEGAPAVRMVAALLSIAIFGMLADAIAAVFVTGAFEAKHTLDERNARLLFDLSALGTSAQMSAFGAFGLFSGWCIVAKGGFPNWTGWLGIVAGVFGVLASACLASSGAFAPFAPLSGSAGFGAFFLYSLVLSVLFLRPERAAPKPAEG